MKSTLPQVISQPKVKQENFFYQKDLITFKGEEKTTKQATNNVVNLLLENVKRINLSPDGIDKTVKGFFNVTRTEITIPKSVKINGEKVKLPDLDDPKDCLKWWKKNIGEAPLSVCDKDMKRARIITKLPSAIRTKLLANLSTPESAKNFKLTVYDNEELIKYRLHLNERRYLIATSKATPTKDGKDIIKTVSDTIYNNYAQKGIQKSKKLIVMLGQKAAGKTTLVDKMRQEYGVIVADSDEIRDIIGTQETELHGRFKAEIKNTLAKKAIKEGANYLAQFHGTGTKNVIKLINQFAKAGYSVEIQNMEVPENKLVERIASRKERSNKDADPLAVILCGKDPQLNNFEEIVKKTKKIQLANFKKIMGKINDKIAKIEARDQSPSRDLQLANFKKIAEKMKKQIKIQLIELKQRYNNDVAYGTPPLKVNG
jgi:predicted kinase